MTRSILGVSVAAVVLLTAACASQARQDQKGSQAGSSAITDSSAATAAPGSPRASAAKSAGPAQPSDEGLSIEERREARDDGFTPMTRHNVTLYCKSEILVGSAFPIRTCYNSDRLKAVLHQYDTQRTQLQQIHNDGMQTH